ncbi:putative Magnetosome protein MamS [Magnetofaba australis IT-1]|uniref:MamS n=1 Tax=Magnetofaba australis IT-1 TaxID=1434232 RepID=W0LIZ9_9PROT|nr:MamS [Magnetofaba australis IT-1]OSM08625.1 putative Magnetosome protein MamS [Magnetofaba australis IT-1]
MGTVVTPQNAPPELLPQGQALQVAQQQNVTKQRRNAALAAGGPGAKTTQQDGATPAQPGLMPFERAPIKRFSGTIQQITELPRRDQQIHIWVTEPGGRELHVSVAPKWFLQFMGCTLSHDAQVNGRGFKFDRANKRDPVVYAKEFTINGRRCQLRNDEGFALWSNKLR